MNLPTLLLFVMATIGLTQIIVESFIFTPVRDLLQKWLPNYIGRLFDCHQCSGFWCGLICGIMIVSHNPLVFLCCGFAGAFLGSWVSTFFTYLEAQSIITVEQNLDEDEEEDGEDV